MTDTKLVKALIKGALTFLPGFKNFPERKKSKSIHSCANAYFCYNLWLYILVHLKENKIGISLERIGEIGNGGSLGVGICALLSGTKEYYALEIEETFNVEHNLVLLEAIINLYKKKTPISDKLNINIDIKCFDYPEDLINPLFSNDLLIEKIRAEITAGLRSKKRLNIIKDWQEYSSLNLDFIFSRAVMEHVKNPSNVYESALIHLRDNALMLHDIEFHSHGITAEPDGHYRISDRIWKIIFGRRRYYINRWALKDHLKELVKQQCVVLKVNEKYKITIDYKNILVGASVLIEKSQNKIVLEMTQRY